jgi:hypothetical protein
LFFAGVGIYQTYVTGYLNIASTANIKFACNYIDPYIFLALLVLDINRLIPTQHIGILYAILGATVLIKYLIFMTSVVRQLTKFLGINLLTVKPKDKKQ